MSYNTGRSGWNRRGPSARDQMAATIDYQTQLNNANSFHWRMEAYAAIDAWDHCGAPVELLKAFWDYFRAAIADGAGSYKMWKDTFVIARETYERNTDISADALAQACGILPECNCKLPEEHCPACERAASASLDDMEMPF